MASRIHFKYWKKVSFSDFVSNFHEMTPQWLQKNFKLLKYEHIIYSFEARDLEILNTFEKYLNFAIL